MVTSTLLTQVSYRYRTIHSHPTFKRIQLIQVRQMLVGARVPEIKCGMTVGKAPCSWKSAEAYNYYKFPECW